MTAERSSRTEIEAPPAPRDRAARAPSGDALRESEERLRLVARATNDAVWDWDIVSGTVWWNEGLKTLFGYSAEEVGPDVKAWEAPVHPDDLPRVSASLREVIDRGGEQWTHEYRFRRADGSYAIVLNRGFLIRDGEGRPVRMVGSMMDVTERRRAEAALAESESKFRSIVETTQEWIWAIDAEARMTYNNPAVKELLGYEPEELLGQPSLDFVHPEDRAHLAEELPALAAEKKGWKGLVVRWLHRDGSVRYFESSAVPILDECLEVAGFRGADRDVTERHRMEEQMREAREAAETASLAKSEFLANMSHEIRTPMNGVIGMTELLLGTSLTDEQREYLDMARSSAVALLDVIDDVLDFSKIEAGRLDLESKAFDVREVLGETLKLLGLRAAEKGLELAYRIDSSVPEALLGDAGRLRQVVVNLVGNAVKFTPAGEVVVFVEQEWADAEEVALHVWVRDTGVGIPREKTEMIFDAFTQADASVTRRFGGTGLGLAISARLVGLMGGGIWVESQPGRGSTFHFMARFRRAPADALPGRGRDVALEGLSVLVADDHEVHRGALVEMLAHWAMTSLAVASGAEALEALRGSAGAKRPFRVALLDARMPGMDGFDVASHVLREEPLQATITPILMLSPDSAAADFARCRSLGLRHLVKPVKQSDLFDVIASVVGTRPTAAPRDGLAAGTSGRARRRLRILVVEDNRVNRRLALGILRKEGHDVHVAVNGLEAVARAQEQPLDLVLMDVQMPVMDGFEATRAIRRSEEGTARHLPIVAMTAHAMTGDRERCLAAGMDEYVPKPLRPPELWAAVDRVLDAGGPAAGSTPPFEAAAALAQAGNDRDLLRELAAIFLEDAPLLLGQVAEALGRDDAPAAERSAHSLKGAATSLSASAVAALAATVEDLARRGELRHAREALGGLDREVRRLGDALRPLLEAP